MEWNTRSAIYRPQRTFRDVLVDSVGEANGRSDNLSSIQHQWMRVPERDRSLLTPSALLTPVVNAGKTPLLRDAIRAASRRAGKAPA
jgi:hypothetical protein